MKDNTRYHIFKVYDYKGGELDSILNLNYEEFINYLTSYFEEYFEEVDFDYDEEIEIYRSVGITKDLCNKYLTDELLMDYFWKIFSSYAGCGIVENWYISSNNELLEYQLSKEDIKLLLEKVKECYTNL